MKILAGFSIFFVCLLLISAIPTASALEIINVEGEYVNEQVKVTLDKSAFVVFRMNNGTPIYAQGEEVYFIPRVKGELNIKALAGEEGATGFVSIVEKPSDGDSEDDNGGITYWWDGSVTLPSGTFTKTAFNTTKTYSISWRTALGALEAASRKGSGFDYKIEETTWGPFVYSIEDKKKYDEGETSGWMYQVNGETPMVGAHDYSVNIRDEIIWYFSKSMDTTPLTSSRVLRIRIVSSGGGGDNGGNGDGDTSPTSTITPIKETGKIKLIEAGGNASLTFNKTEITKIAINANNTIRNAEVTIQQIEKRPENITNVSGMPYCYFNITTTNLTDANITNATIEFKVNKSWLNESDIAEATITLNRYSDINNNWSALPTSKIKEDNASLYFEAETLGFSLFAISGEEKTVISPATLTPSPALTPKLTHPPATAPASTPSALIPRIKWIIITAVVVALLLIALVAYLMLRVRKE
ncbi:MAG: PGF-pre-PGF domain-containing protein [Methanophagales archaeon]|nr:PGF-pre-PGF domain-containing protein [Methanophagales archaeon]